MTSDPRPILPLDRIDPRAAQQMHAFHKDFLDEVKGVIDKNDIALIGMGQNPVVKKAKKLLDDANLKYAYVGHGSYLSGYRRRLIIKLWSGWPYFPQVFVKGTLIGGAADLEAGLKDGSIARRLAT